MKFETVEKIHQYVALIANIVTIPILILGYILGALWGSLVEGFHFGRNDLL